MNNKLLIIGAGDYGQIAYEIAESMGKFEKIEFLDDKSELAIGTVGDIEKFAEEYSFGIVAIGDSKIRNELTRRLKENCYHIPVLVHPKAFVGKYVSLKRGCIVEPMAVINSGSRIGECTFISAGAIVNHSVLIDAYCHINIGAIVKAHSVLPMFTKVGEGKIYHEIDFCVDVKNNKNRTDDFRKEWIKMNCQELSIFKDD